MQPWAVEWDEAAVDFLIEQGFSAELGARPLKRAVERHLLTPLATAIVERQFPEGDQFLFITARDGTGLDVAFVDPDAGEPEPTAAEQPARSRRPHARARRARAGRDRGRGRLPARASSRRSSSASGSWDDAEAGCAGRGARAGLLAVGGTARGARPDRVPRPARRRDGDGRAARRRASRRAREAHSRELVQLLATPTARAAAALAGLDAREASDATVTVRAGKAEDTAACGRFVEELAAMYVGWADGRGMRVRRNGVTTARSCSRSRARRLHAAQAGDRAPRARAPARGRSLVRPRHRARRRRAGRASAANGRTHAGSARAGDRAALPARARHRSFATRPGCARAGSTACWQATSTCSRDAPPTSALRRWPDYGSQALGRTSRPAAPARRRRRRSRSSPSRRFVDNGWPMPSSTCPSSAGEQADHASTNTSNAHTLVAPS